MVNKLVNHGKVVKLMVHNGKSRGDNKEQETTVYCPWDCELDSHKISFSDSLRAWRVYLVRTYSEKRILGASKLFQSQVKLPQWHRTMVLLQYGHLFLSDEFGAGFHRSMGGEAAGTEMDKRLGALTVNPMGLVSWRRMVPLKRSW